jgi:DNA-binding MarR family transcriptional regulator
MRRRRNSCLAVLEQIRAIGFDVSLSETICFLYICENEGINVRELAQLAGLTPSSASRAARRLTTPDAPCALAPALGLVQLTIQASDRRGRILTLTPAGKSLRQTIDVLIAAAHPIEPESRRLA